MRFWRWLLVVFLLFGLTTARAQEKPRRPRVGLVLAGGSARSFVHVGVLKWLEEHRIPVDFVAGTSMGGLVGGLYASGMSAEEIDAAIRGIDWNTTLSLEPPYEEASFRRKEDRREYPTRIELGLRKGFHGPSALSPGEGVELLLSRLVPAYSDMAPFDDLPTPFRCMATDLVEGGKVELADGDLSQALRATMSLPGVFAPVRRGKMVLVDGGLLNNLPTDVAAKMGADIIIAVTMFEPPDPTVAEQSLLGVVGRSIDIMVDDNAHRNLHLANRTLNPNTSGLGKTDFDRYAEFYRRGYEEAARQAASLQDLALSEAEWQEYLRARASRRRNATITPQFIEIAGARDAERADIEKRLLPFVGHPLDAAALETELTRITGLGRYDGARYVLTEKDGKPGLRVSVREKIHSPPALRMLPTLDGAQIDDVRFSLASRITFYDLGGPNSEWRTDLSFGNRNRFATEYYWRIGGGPLFVAPRAAVDYSRINLYSGKDRIAVYAQNRAGGGLDVGFSFGRLGEIRAGYDATHLDAFVVTGVQAEARINGVYQTFRGQWTVDALDAAVVPRRGFAVRGHATWVIDGPLVTESFPIVENSVLVAVPFTRRSHMISVLSGGTTAGRHIGIRPFTLGGPGRLSALAVDQLRGFNYYSGGFYFLRSLSERPLTFLGSTYMTFGYEAGNAFDTLSSGAPFHDGLFGLMSDTPIGGFFVGVSFGQNNERKIFFRLGRLF
jgi:NTE family protein